MKQNLLLCSIVTSLAMLSNSQFATAQDAPAGLIEIPGSQAILTEDNEYSISFYEENDRDWNAYIYDRDSSINNYYQGSTKLTAVVNVDEDAFFFYHLYWSSSYAGVYSFSVSIDGGDPVAHNTSSAYNSNYLYELSSGRHTIEWTFKEGESFSMSSVCAYPKGNLITVNLFEPGSLGTEVLYNVDGLKDVMNLKIIGKINDDDWEKLGMMTNLRSLDMSQVSLEGNVLPDKCFRGFEKINKVILPEGITHIGDDAFNSCKISEIVLPSTLVSIGMYAFANTLIQNIDFPSSLKYIGRGAFDSCNLSDVVLPEGLEEIGISAFYGCPLREIVIPSSVKEIGAYAFFCNYLLEDFVIPETVEILGESVVGSCVNLKNITVSSKVFDVVVQNHYNRLAGSCKSLETVRLNSATKVLFTIDDVSNAEKCKLIVPEHLVSEYKLDPYYYNFGTIEGFPTNEIDDWTINMPLTLNNRRLEGNPSITIAGDHYNKPYLKINGEDAMDINNLSFGWGKWNYSWQSTPYQGGQFFSNCDNVKVNGTVSVKLYTDDRHWYFFSMPFDVKVSDIVREEGVQAAVRYYDGASRAAGELENWKDYAQDAIIPAGTGFIYRTNKETSNVFYSVDNVNKQQVVSAKEFVKTLSLNASDDVTNSGWNLVGNPWQCYYNNHGINFTAPITVWDPLYSTYNAYSLIDDDYAIKPNQAFFVQATSEMSQIGFPAIGRQFNDEILWQSPSAAPTRAAIKRQLINLTLSSGEQTDRTRVVINDAASLGYDATTDASKFMSFDASVPQLYSLGEGNSRFAINERPANDGLVKLGFYAPADGEYTIATTRCDAGSVELIDIETGKTVDIANNQYTFKATKGTFDARFAISILGKATGIEQLSDDTDSEDAILMSLDGRILDPASANKGVHIRQTKGNTQKVIIK